MKEWKKQMNVLKHPRWLMKMVNLFTVKPRKLSDDFDELTCSDQSKIPPWLRRAKLIFLKSGTEESMKVLHCVLALRGTGATWVNNSPFRNGGGNFDLFENRLEDRFISKLMPFEFFIKAFNYRLLPDGSPSAYADIVVNNLQKANVTDPLTCFCALYNGLPEELQVHIMMDNDSNKLTKGRVIELLKNMDSLKLQTFKTIKGNNKTQGATSTLSTTSKTNDNNQGTNEKGNNKKLPPFTV
eukprot:Nk52_evm1s575 gene=Nk52_evmTU1s575